jgi:DNA-binding IclR family transcriptional regulator
MSAVAASKRSPSPDVPPRREPFTPQTAPGVLGGLGDDRLNSVLGKCAAMLEAIDRSRTKSLTVTELSRASGVPKASVHRLSTKLVDSGLLDKVGERYSIGIHMFELAYTVPHLRRLREAAMPHLVDLYAYNREVVHLAILVGHDVLYLEKLAGSRSASMPSAVGRRMPSHCTGLGKAILAFSTVDPLSEVFIQSLRRRTRETIVAPSVLAGQLSRVHAEHLAYEHDEAVPGVSCIAAPVLSRDGRAIAAISISVPTCRFRPGAMRNQLMVAASRLSKAVAQAPVWQRDPRDRLVARVPGGEG